VNVFYINYEVGFDFTDNHSYGCKEAKNIKR